MKRLARYIYKETLLGHFLLRPAKMAIDYFVFRLVPEPLFLRITFRRQLGYRLNLDRPKSLNEKIQWLKLNDRDPLYTFCADKFTVRKLIKNRIGEEYLIPLIFHTTTPSEINTDNLPDRPFIIKTNHLSGGEVIVTSKSELDWRQIQEHFAHLLQRNHYPRTKEWQYRNIEPRILVEVLLLDDYGRIPKDFKLHCFNGKLLFTQVDIDRHGRHRRNLYDQDWILLDCRWIYDNGPHVERPPTYSLMKTLAERLAADFRYVRVDFYTMGNKIFFGELTFHPESGFGKFMPEFWDHRFGDALDISARKLPPRQIKPVSPDS
jgi:hypothetical protein